MQDNTNSSSPQDGHEIIENGKPGNAVDVEVEVHYPGNEPDLGRAVWLHPPSKLYPHGQYTIIWNSDKWMGPSIVPAGIVYFRDGSPIVKPKQSGVQSWQPIRYQDLPPASPFPIDVFPAKIQRYCRELSETMLAPTDFAGVSILTTAGAAIGQTVNIQVKTGWIEPPLLFSVLVAPPGKTKSPVIRAVVRPLAEINERLREQSKNDWREWKRAKDNCEPGEDPGPEPPQHRKTVKDITREALALVLQDNPAGILCDPDEATSWVSSFNEYKSKGSDRQFWLSIWSCSEISVDRKSRRESIQVKFPFASMLGSIPPAMLGVLGDDQGRNDGFLDRIIFVYPGLFPRQQWTDTELSNEVQADWGRVINRLCSTPMLGDGVKRPNVVTFSLEAKQRFVAWFNEINDEMESPSFLESQAGAWSKLRAHAARFALILSRIRCASEMVPVESEILGGLISEFAPISPIELIDVEGAIKLATYFKSHILRVDHQMTGGLASPDARQIVNWIKRKKVKTFRSADIATDLRRFYDEPEKLVDALTYLAERGVIRHRTETSDPGKKGRKPTPGFEVNPFLLEVPEITINTNNGHA
jgi:hypothetical protein